MAETNLISSDIIRDKIRGGWAGQAIGCSYGGSMEFKWLGTWIPEKVAIEWNDELMPHYFDHMPTLYDDIYVDMTFLAAFKELGLDATPTQLAGRFARTEFRLWHGNQIARLNILKGIMPPMSGHYRHNPHAEDVDFQIESDFIGLLCPGLPAVAQDYALRIGSIIAYGDGVYGGVFVASAYSFAFIEDDPATVVTKAVESLPPESQYARCIRDVITWWQQWPEDWHRCWWELQQKWSQDVGCPECVLRPCSMDAKLNGAYIAIGLLYGEGDFEKTIEITTRCGQDSDSNAANAGGIIGALLGYSSIDERWRKDFEEVESLALEGAAFNLTTANEVTYRLAAEMVRKYNGQPNEEYWLIPFERVDAFLKADKGFKGLRPAELIDLEDAEISRPFSITFKGKGFVVQGRMAEYRGQARCTVHLDGRLIEDVVLQGDLTYHSFPYFWAYDLQDGNHTLEIVKVSGDAQPLLIELVVYR